MPSKQLRLQNGSHLGKLILWSGLLVGTLDIALAMMNYYFATQKNPLNVLPFIASGLFGSKAFSGQPQMIIWGLLFHFIIAYTFTAIFFFVYPKIGLLHRNKIVTALLYGLFIWCVMNLLVVPLSSTPKIPFDTIASLKGALILIVAIGLPLSLIAHRYYTNTSKPLQ